MHKNFSINLEQIEIKIEKKQLSNFIIKKSPSTGSNL